MAFGKLVMGEGSQYKNFDEAWDEYYQAMHSDMVIGADDYHKERMAFLTGAISAINVLSVRINSLADEMPLHQQVPTAIMSTLSEALHQANDESARVRK